jgi:hypothetical protein
MMATHKSRSRIAEGRRQPSVVVRSASVSRSSPVRYWSRRMGDSIAAQERAKQSTKASSQLTSVSPAA